jgi:hypothetical protein
MDHSARLRGGVRSTFSREQCIRPTLLMTHERLPRTGTAHGKCTLGVRGLAWEAYAGRTWIGVGSVRVVLVGFSPTGCTLIRIAVTLGYE